MTKKLIINELELNINIPNTFSWNNDVVQILKEGIEYAFDQINSQNQTFKNEVIDFMEIDLGTLSGTDAFADTLIKELWVVLAPYFKILDAENSSATLYDLFKSPKKTHQTQEVWSYLNSSFEFSAQNIEELIKNWEQNSVLSFSDLHELMTELLGHQLSGELLSWYRKNFGESIDAQLLKLFILLFQRKKSNLSINNTILFESIFELWFKKDIYLLLFHSKNGVFEENLWKIVLSNLSDDEIIEMNHKGFFQNIIKGNSLDHQNLSKLWQKRLIQTYSLQKVDDFLSEKLPVYWTNSTAKKSYQELQFFLHLLSSLNISPNRKLYSVAINAVFLGKPFDAKEWIAHFFELVYPELPTEWRNLKRFEEQMYFQLAQFNNGKKSIKSISEYWLWIKQSDIFMLLWNKSIPAALKRLSLISEYLYQSATVNPKYPWKKRLFPTTNLSPNISKDAPKVIEILIGDIKNWLNVTTPFSTSDYSDKEILHIRLVIGEIKSLLFDFETFLMILSRYYNRSEGWWREWVFTSPIQKQYLFNIWRDTVLQIQKLEQVVTIEILEREYHKNDNLDFDLDEIIGIPNIKSNDSIELLYNELEDFKQWLTEEEWSVLQKFIEDQNSESSNFKLKFKSIENALLIWLSYWKYNYNIEVPANIKIQHKAFQIQWWKEIFLSTQWLNQLLSSHHVGNTPQHDFILTLSKELSLFIDRNLNPEFISNGLFQNHFIQILENQRKVNMKLLEWKRSEISLLAFFNSKEFQQAIYDITQLLSIQNELTGKIEPFEPIHVPLLEVQYSQDFNFVLKPEAISTLNLKFDSTEESIVPILPGLYVDIVAVVKDLFHFLTLFDDEKKSPWLLKVNHLISNLWSNLSGYTVLVLDRTILKFIDLIKLHSQNFYQNLLLTKTFLRGIEDLLKYSVPENLQLQVILTDLKWATTKTIDGLNELQVDFAKSINNLEHLPELELYSLKSLFEEIGWGNLIDVSETIKEISLDFEQFKESKQFWELFLKQNSEMIHVLKKHPQRNDWIKTLSLKTEQGIKRLSDLFSLETSVDWFNTVTAYGWKMQEKSIWELSLLIKTEHSSSSQWLFIDGIKQLLFEIQTPLTKIQFLQLVLKVYRKIEPNISLGHVAKFINVFQDLLEFSENEREFVRIEHDLPKVESKPIRNEFLQQSIDNKTDLYDLKFIEPALLLWTLEHPNMSELALDSTLSLVWDSWKKQNLKFSVESDKSEIIKKWKIEIADFMWNFYIKSSEPLNQKSNYFMSMAQAFAHWKSTYQLPYTLQISNIKPIHWIEWLNKVKTPSFIKQASKVSEISDPLNELNSDVHRITKILKENDVEEVKKEAPYPSFFNELNWQVLGPDAINTTFIGKLFDSFKEWKSTFFEGGEPPIPERFQEQLYLLILVSNENKFTEFIASIFDHWGEHSELISLEIKQSLKSTIQFIQDEIKKVMNLTMNEKEINNELFQTLFYLRLYHSLFSSNTGLFYQEEWLTTTILKINEESNKNDVNTKAHIAKFFKSIESKISFSLTTESNEWYHKLIQVNALTTAPVSGILAILAVLYNDSSESTNSESSLLEHPIEEANQWIHQLRKFNFDLWLLNYWLPKTLNRYVDIDATNEENESLEIFETWTINFLGLFEKGLEKYEGSPIEPLLISVFKHQKNESLEKPSEEFKRFAIEVREKINVLWKKDLLPLKQTQKLLTDPVQKEFLKLQELGERIELPIKVRFEQSKSSVNEQIKIEINRGTRYTANLCGMMLLAPFWGTLFRRLELLEKNEFKTSEHKLLAYQTILAVARIDEEIPLELQDLIPRIIVGIPPENELSNLPVLSISQVEEITKFISAVRSQWPVMINFSNRGFIESFLLRRGTVWKESDSKWMIEVEGYGSDIIMQTLPWGYATMKFPWTSYMIFTEWKAP